MTIIKKSPKNHLVWNTFDSGRPFSAQQKADILSYGVFSRSPEADAEMKQEMGVKPTPTKKTTPKQENEAL